MKVLEIEVLEGSKYIPGGALASSALLSNFSLEVNLDFNVLFEQNSCFAHCRWIYTGQISFFSCGFNILGQLLQFIQTKVHNELSRKSLTKHLFNK